jgi:predicted RecA/RadA family phage recombinase
LLFFLKLLFTNEPPAGSKIAILKKIAQETDKTKRARLIIENEIPYRVAASLLGQVDVQTAIALLAVMTPQEALNSRSFLEQSGAFELPEVKAEYLKKIQKATGSAATVTNRKSVKGNDAEINAALDTVANKAAQKGLRIKNPVTVFVDISGSLAASIAWSKEVLARLAAASDDVIKVVLYRDSATGRHNTFHCFGDTS